VARSWDDGFSLIGLTLAIFLGFRNGTSYARYWEARTLWGGVLNDTRALVRQALTLVDTEGAAPHEARTLATRLIAFVRALRHQLRRTDPAADFARLLAAPEIERLRDARFKPALLLLMAGEWLRDRRRAGQIDPALVQAMERPLWRWTRCPP
jgi:putative membrane protein